MAYPLHRPSEPTGDGNHPVTGGRPAVPASPDLPALEMDVLAYWAVDVKFSA